MAKRCKAFDFWKYCLGQLLNGAAFVPLFEILIYDLSNMNPFKIVEYRYTLNTLPLQNINYSTTACIVKSLNLPVT